MRSLASPSSDREATGGLLFVVRTAAFGTGPEGRALRLAKAVRGRGVPVTVAALCADHEPGARERHVITSGVRIVVLGSGGLERVKSYRLDVAFAVRRFVERTRPAVVLPMESLADAIVKTGLLFRPEPIVTLLGIGRWHWERKAVRRAQMRCLARRSAGVIANGRQCIDGWTRAVGQAALERVPRAVLHGPADPEEFPLAEARTPDGRLVLGALGRFHAQKGFDVLLDAFARLPERVAGERLVLAIHGAGPDGGDLVARARMLGIGSRVEWREPGDAPAFYRSIDALVAPSRWAGLDNAPLEASLTGRAVFVSDGTGFGELGAPDVFPTFTVEAGALAAHLSQVLVGGREALAARADAQRRHLLQHLAPAVVGDALLAQLSAWGLWSSTAANAAPEGQRSTAAPLPRLVTRGG